MSTNNVNQNTINIGMPEPARNQRPWLLRAIWFLSVGWILSLLWVLLAWIVAITIVGLPVAQGMFARTNAVMTLQRLK